MTMKLKSTVLIVDDQQTMRDTLKCLLDNQGYELAFAKNGPEALSKATQLIPDIILLDVMMPGMDGFEVCKKLRADEKMAKVPIVMVTSLDGRDSRLRGIEAGADDFISKPYDTLELQARVQTITKLNRYRRLLTEQAKFEWVVNNTDEAYLILDNNNQVIYANSKARFYLNQPTNPDEPINETFLELTAKNYHQLHEPKSPGKWLELPRYLVCPDTETAQAFWLEVNIMEMFTGVDEKYLIHLRDITDTILNNRRKWTLQSQITHKLKTPLTAIRTSQYILDNFSTLTKAQIRKWLEMINKGEIRLQSEIEEIIEYMNISSMAQTTLKPCNVTDMLSTITNVKEMLDIESVDVSQADIENPERTFVSIASSGLEIILTELFSNAKKFHPFGKPCLEINIAAVSNGICLRASDDGLILSPVQLANMWTPYYQGEKYFTGELQGMGLGLSMVASMIWEIGGTCNAYNRGEKNGVVIELNLPTTKIKNYKDCL